MSALIGYHNSDLEIPRHHLFNQALAYHEQGFAVVPMLVSDEAGGEKKPLAKWSRYQKSPQRREEVERLFLRPWRMNGLGLVLPPGLIHVESDSDGSQGVLLDSGPIPGGTPIYDSPRGAHLFWATDVPLRSKQIIDGLEVLPPGSLIVVPPSEGREFWPDSPPIIREDIPPMPGWFERILREHLLRKQKQILPETATVATSDSTLAQCYRNPSIVARLLPFLGITSDAISGKAFLCVLPDHDEKKPSATITRGDNGNFVYHDWHHDEQVLLLADVYAAQMSGRVEKLSRILRAFWGLRLLIRAGVMCPASIVFRPLPDNVRPHVLKAYEGIRELFAIRWLSKPGEPAPISWKFLASWAGITVDEARGANKKLLQLGVIHEVEKRRIGPFQPTILFMPGPGLEKSGSPSTPSRPEGRANE